MGVDGDGVGKTFFRAEVSMLISFSHRRYRSWVHQIVRGIPLSDARMCVGRSTRGV